MNSPALNIRRGGFTLMELMVVVAIIAVLVALLMPGMAKMSRNAQGSHIASQMRQLGQAVFSYAGEHDGQLPGPLWDGQGFRYKATHPEALMTHLGSYLGVQNVDANWRIADQLMTPPQRAFWHKINNDSAAFLKITVSGSVIPFGYSSGATVTTSMRLQSLVTPSETYMFREADQKASWVSISSGYYRQCPPAPLHGDYRYISYFDGSIRPVAVKESDRQ